MIKHGLSALALMMIPPSAAETPETIDVEVVKLVCTMSQWSVFERYSTGTGVRHGSLTITAAHVLDKCPEQLGIMYFPGHDLALKYDGIPTDYELGCDAPVVGEDIVYIGYPNGDDLERDTGTVIQSGGVQTAVQAGGGALNIFSDLALGTSELVRPGYSGGIVTTTDGHFRGIISSVNSTTRDTLFIPADLICEFIVHMADDS
jgi:hypothetical protein